jgi:hypothetical protein
MLAAVFNINIMITLRRINCHNILKIFNFNILVAFQLHDRGVTCIGAHDYITLLTFDL